MILCQFPWWPEASHYRGSWALDSGPLREQQVLLTLTRVSDLFALGFAPRLEVQQGSHVHSIYVVFVLIQHECLDYWASPLPGTISQVIVTACLCLLLWFIWEEWLQTRAGAGASSKLPLTSQPPAQLVAPGSGLTL